MNIIVTGRNIEITSALKDYAENKVNKFAKYLSSASEATVTLSVQKFMHKAEVLLKSNGNMIQAESVTEEAYSAIDEVVDKLERQVKKFKEKLTSHRKEGTAPVVSELPEEEETVPETKIITKERIAMKPMTAEEAAMQMELTDRNFFLFTNADNGEINLIYRKSDEDLGLIEPA